MTRTSKKNFATNSSSWSLFDKKMNCDFSLWALPVVDNTDALPLHLCDCLLLIKVNHKVLVAKTNRFLETNNKASVRLVVESLSSKRVIVRRKHCWTTSIIKKMEKLFIYSFRVSPSKNHESSPTHPLLKTRTSNICFLFWWLQRLALRPFHMSLIRCFKFKTRFEPSSRSSKQRLDQRNAVCAKGQKIEAIIED